MEDDLVKACSTNKIIVLFNENTDLVSNIYKKVPSSVDSDRKVSGNSPFMNSEPIFTNNSWWHYTGNK